MEDYALYLESGPKHKKTMVHVPGLLGCVIRGATTEEALNAVPDGINRFRQFLQTSGEWTGAADPFITHIEAHVVESGWIGEGDPACGFAPDFLPLSRPDLQRYVARLEAIHHDILKMVQAIPPQYLYEEPSDGHRSIYHILEHSADSDYTYLRMQTGPDKEIVRVKKAINSANPLLAGALLEFWLLLAEKLLAFSDEDLTRQVPHGQTTWTASRTLRRALEHNWEHREEIRGRLDQNDGAFGF